MKKYLLIIVVFFCIACTREGELLDPFGPEATDLDIVTGLSFRNERGQEDGAVGNPNARNGQTTFFPNPANNEITIRSNQTIEQIWFLRAEKNTAFGEVDFGELLTGTNFDPLELESKSELSVTKMGKNIQVSTSLLSSDYYRVFFLLDNDSIVVDNLFIDRINDYNRSIEALFGEWN